MTQTCLKCVDQACPHHGTDHPQCDDWTNLPEPEAAAAFREMTGDALDTVREWLPSQSRITLPCPDQYTDLSAILSRLDDLEAQMRRVLCLAELADKVLAVVGHELEGVGK